MNKIELCPLSLSAEETFIKEIQIAFSKAVIEKYGPQQPPVIPREDVEKSLHGKNAQAFRIVANGNDVGGVVVAINKETQNNSLELLYINPDYHSKGIGQKVWQMIEEKYPETEIRETYTPYFETRNIHFYVNRCGFHIVESFNPQHPGEATPEIPVGEFFFRFEKVMQK